MKLSFLAAGLAITMGCLHLSPHTTAQAFAQTSAINELENTEGVIHSYSLEEFASELHFPKSMAILPNDTLLIAERDGFVTVITADKSRSRFSLALPELYTQGQGGLLDLLVIESETSSGDSANNVSVLVSYSKGSNDSNRLAVVKTTLSLEQGFGDIHNVYEVNEAKDTPVHYGGKLLALQSGGFLVTTGDGFDYREKAQVQNSHLGKVIGFTIDGAPLPNAPFKNSPYIYTLGHRNPQGLVYGADGEIYQHEHGPDGGDELNRIEVGVNYGWPVVTLGKDYSGANISPFTHYKGMQDPLVNWTPSIAPSSMTFYSQTAFPTLQNTLLVTSLKAKQLFAIITQTDKFEVHPVLNSHSASNSLYERLRDVVVDSEGNILVLTDGENSKVMRISPR
jgi:glucose/arabinose dehydrogenase